MKFQFFGSRNLRSAEDLRSVGKAKPQARKRDDWGLDPVSALRVPILGSYSNESKTGQSDTDKPLIQTRARNTLRLVEADSKPSLQNLGIYSPCAIARQELHSHLASMAVAVTVFDDDSIDIESAAKIDGWLIHMLDEDDSPFLDAILDLDTYDQSLFLCEAALTEQCMKKVKDFIR